MSRKQTTLSIASALLTLSACAVLEGRAPTSGESDLRTHEPTAEVAVALDEDTARRDRAPRDTEAPPPPAAPVGAVPVAEEVALESAGAPVPTPRRREAEVAEVVADDRASSSAPRPPRPTAGASAPPPGASAPPPGASAPPPGASAPPSRRGRSARPSSPQVQAGAADDNLQFHAFLDFVNENRQLGLPVAVEDRVVLRVVDADGLPVPDARIHLGGTRRRTTYADGRTLLHPRRWGLPGDQRTVEVSALGQIARVPLGAARGRKLEVQLDARREAYQGVPLDIAFVLDTTGSMSDELARLRDTFDVITYQVSQLRPRPQVRFGMVLYRDRSDAYLTRVVPFTEDVGVFEAALAKLAAGGGGDTPEDVQEGLRVALQDLQWREAGLRLAFLVGDAPPHLDYGQSYTYVEALEEAALRGIKITTVGASGLDRQGELVWRQIAQATAAPFVFLTYGETGDSEGSASTVSHHVGSNWSAASLDAIIVRMVKQELAHYGARPQAPREDWFSAAPSPSASTDEVLEDLFERSTRQLVDYAVEPLEDRTPTVLLPLAGKGAERLERRLAMGLARKAQFQLLETVARSRLLAEVAQQMRHGYDEAKMVDIGKMVPAKLAVLGQLDGGPGEREMLLKLVRLETGEILSLSLLKIDGRLL